MNKPILCLDFDGVLHSYTSGWKGADVIPDPPVPGAIEFLLSASQVFRVAIYSSRSNQPGGIQAMQDWLYLRIAEQNLQLADEKQLINSIEWPTEKPAAFVGIDDRVITFTGEWPSVDTLRNFQPWNKRKAGG